MTERRIGRHAVQLSHPDKTMFPDIGMSKRGVVDYYERIAEYMLPHIEDRPLTLHRFPDGIDKPGFYQQARGGHFPDWLPGLEIEHGGDTGNVCHVLCDSAAALAYLANQGVIALHAWLSRRDKLHQPDQIIVDLDPPGDDFEPVRQAALQVAAFMRELGLTPFVKTTGSRGLHVIAPIRAGSRFRPRAQMRAHDGRGAGQAPYRHADHSAAQGQARQPPVSGHHAQCLRPDRSGTLLAARQARGAGGHATGLG